MPKVADIHWLGQSIPSDF